MQSIEVVLLAGRIRPSPLGESLDLPALCLPIGGYSSLLRAWLHTLDSIENINAIRIVVNSDLEVDALRLAAQQRPRTRGELPRVNIVAEPAPWRGAAGIVRDVTADVAIDSWTIVCEANRLPPPCLDPLLLSMRTPGMRPAGVIGLCGSDEPAGVYLFSQRAIHRIPTIGYHDLKEQFIPKLRQAGHCVLCCPISNAVWRVNDLDSYLACVRESLISRGESVQVNEHASVSPTATMSGACLIESGAMVEEGALIHESVVLWGATVGAGAVVSRSVVGSLACVTPHQRVMRSIISPHVTYESIGRYERAAGVWPLRRFEWASRRGN